MSESRGTVRVVIPSALSPVGTGWLPSASSSWEIQTHTYRCWSGCQLLQGHKRSFILTDVHSELSSCRTSRGVCTAAVSLWCFQVIFICSTASGHCTSSVVWHTTRLASQPLNKQKAPVIHHATHCSCSQSGGERKRGKEINLTSKLLELSLQLFIIKHTLIIYR